MIYLVTTNREEYRQTSSYLELNQMMYVGRECRGIICIAYGEATLNELPYEYRL